MSTRIKICGVTLPDDAARVASVGVDFIGLNFWPRSKRHLDPARAPLVAGAARGAGEPKIVGVFVDASVDEVAQIAADVPLDIVQLHGDETPDDVTAIAKATKLPVWKSLALGSATDVEHLEVWPVEHLLLDTPSAGRGGSGKTFDWSLAALAHRRHPARQFLLAGGLDPANVAAAIAAVAPWGVDVATGVEVAPGIKDADKVAAFVAAVRGA
ncbi:MAG: N-(5'-phosphoribosyl)anthranilate isomerase [Kofleriaceae bacterium]